MFPSAARSGGTGFPLVACTAYGRDLHNALMHEGFPDTMQRRGLFVVSLFLLTPLFGLAGAMTPDDVTIDGSVAEWDEDWCEIECEICTAYTGRAARWGGASICAN